MKGASEAIPVVAAVICEHGRVLLCQRHDGDHLPLLWEFPGGKIEPGETGAEALRRELSEELAVDSEIGAEILRVTHAYPTKTVRLQFFWARIHGTPHAIVHRRLEWVAQQGLSMFTVPPPNAIVVEQLRCGGISMDTPTHSPSRPAC